MNEKVRLFMMPVCVCGHVFRDLRLVPVEYPTGVLDSNRDIFYKVQATYDPPVCPKCNRIIETVATRDFRNEIDGSIIFIKEENVPEKSPG